MPQLSEQTVERLPCRGCMRDCPHLSVCDGMPWRMPVDRQMFQASVAEGASPDLVDSDHKGASES